MVVGLGVGLGQGKQKFNALPAPHTDSIFAVIGEELGVCWVPQPSSFCLPCWVCEATVFLGEPLTHLAPYWLLDLQPGL